MRVFVTGATGFVGRAAVRALLARGHRVLAVSRDAESARILLPGADLVQGGLDAPDRLLPQVERFAPEALLHLAWEGLPDYSEATSRRNVALGLAAYALARQAGAVHMVTTGSCWEYASRTGQLREDAPLRDDQSFPAAKNELRRQGLDLARSRGVDFTWLRLFFVYGPGQRPTSLVPSLISQALRGEAPALRCPANRNDFIHVDDVALALALVLEKRPGGGVYNVGGGLATQVADVARFVYAALGQEKILQAWETGLDQPPASEDFWADMSRLRADTGFCPRMSLREGVLDMARRALKQQKGESR